jgi:phage terminase large subunit-like protein
MTSPENPAPGDYVVATKWSDGDLSDHWCVGVYDGEKDGRHFVKDASGQQFRINGFRRVQKITAEESRWLLEIGWRLEGVAAGAASVWSLLSSMDTLIDRDTWEEIGTGQAEHNAKGRGYGVIEEDT